ncbi:MAG TPA: hypothetical protein VNB90_07510 [Cytophagaceae bacterium]|jgi:hypothetical protein|nr:hypothetical protein [Cytophagaceae bacterium]
MSQEKDHLQQLQEIRSLMERSTKFISLSGLSGIVAGCIALAGAALQYWYMAGKGRYELCVRLNNDFLIFTVLNFLGILILALLSAYYFTQKKAKKNNQSLWDSSSQRLLQNIAIPLVCGGLFCIVLYYYGIIGLIAPASLIFYGLALINGSNFTLRDIRYLGMTEIALGFIAAFNIGLGLLFWAIGFGLLHIIYGIVMYYKYDKVSR